ncbi:MAG: hypothetical protein LBQ46_10910 [Treponema sp.]|nr:hypothetical protein [Treponema sp.]
MRKVFIVLLILLALGGAGFFFGWAQMDLVPGSYGVMRSKTHGIDAALIREGEFRWVWYKLIPSNVTIQVYRPVRVERTVNHRGTLPSSDVYTGFAGVAADFSYEFSAVLSFSIGAESLIPLIGERNISGQEELEAYAEALGEELEAAALGALRRLGEDGEEVRAILETGSSAALEGELRSAFPYADDLECRIPAIRFPDFELYSRLRGLYTDYLNSQREYLARALDGGSERQIDSRFRMDELARYGELLTRYPVLLEYLKLEGSR